MLASANCSMSALNASSQFCQSTHGVQSPVYAVPSNVPSYRVPSLTPLTQRPQSLIALLNSPAVVRPNAVIEVLTSAAQVSHGTVKRAEYGALDWPPKQM